MKRETLNLRSEVSKIGEELFETKIELRRQYNLVNKVSRESDEVKMVSKRLEEDLASCTYAAAKKESDLVKEIKQANEDIKKKDVRVNANKKLHQEILNTK